MAVEGGVQFADLIRVWLVPPQDNVGRRELLSWREDALEGAGGWQCLCQFLTATLAANEKPRRAAGIRGYLVTDARMILTIDGEAVSYGAVPRAFGRGHKVQLRGPATRTENRPAPHGSYTLDRVPPTLERLAEYLPATRDLVDPEVTARSWPSERNRRLRRR